MSYKTDNNYDERKETEMNGIQGRDASVAMEDEHLRSNDKSTDDGAAQSRSHPLLAEKQSTDQKDSCSDGIGDIGKESGTEI